MLTWSHAQVKGGSVCCPQEPLDPPQIHSLLSSSSAEPCSQTHRDWGGVPRQTSLHSLNRVWPGRSQSCWPNPRSCRPSASVRHAVRVRQYSGATASGANHGWRSNYLMLNLGKLKKLSLKLKIIKHRCYVLDFKYRCYGEVFLYLHHAQEWYSETLL